MTLDVKLNLSMSRTPLHSREAWLLPYHRVKIHINCFVELMLGMSWCMISDSIWYQPHTSMATSILSIQLLLLDPNRSKECTIEAHLTAQWLWFRLLDPHMSSLCWILRQVILKSWWRLMITKPKAHLWIRHHFTESLILVILFLGLKNLRIIPVYSRDIWCKQSHW